MTVINNVDDLRDAVEEDWEFYDAANLGDQVVTEADASLEPVEQDQRFTVSDDAWAFISEEAGQFHIYHYVEPADGGSNSAVVRTFMYRDEELGAHHEVYARGYTELSNGGEEA